MINLCYWKDADFETYDWVGWCTATTPKKIVGANWAWQIAPNMSLHKAAKKMTPEHFLACYKHSLETEKMEYIKSMLRKHDEEKLWIQLLFFEKEPVGDRVALYEVLKTLTDEVTIT